MSKFEVEDNAKDLGPDPTKHNAEHWSSVKTFPFLQTDDWWFPKTGSKFGDFSSNSYFIIPGSTSVSGYVMSNGTFQNVSSGPTSVPEEIFAHPDSRPTFGKCKQCGVDDSCPMWQCMQ